MEKNNLSEVSRKELEAWDAAEGAKDSCDQQWQNDCSCFSMIQQPGLSDVWKGHVCTTDMRKFKSPLVRALLPKGHAFKVEEGEESLLRELHAGLNGYIAYKERRAEDRGTYNKWKQLIILRVKEKLALK